MFLSSGDFYSRYRPTTCDLRLFLRRHGAEETEPSPYEEVIRHLGERHERAHLATFPVVVDLSAGTQAERSVRTIEACRDGVTVIYQPVLQGTASFDGVDWHLGGSPDFLIREHDGYVIRDVKMSRRITERDHPEILWQLRLYGRLFEESVGRPPLRLEVLSGAAEFVPIDKSDGRALEDELSTLAGVIAAAEAPFEPVGWSKCSGCGYQGRCWEVAGATHSAALIPKADQGTVRVLRQMGLNSYDEVLQRLDVATLAAIQRPWGQQMRKIGESAAEDIIRSARALGSQQMIVLAAPQIPVSRNYAMFDLEGLPPQLDDLEKVYLWGVRVFGEVPSAFMPATAGFGHDGDRAGWGGFLDAAAAIFSSYGDIPFVHWHHYERVKLDLYVERYGDRDGLAERVRANLLDLLPVMQKSVTLPLPSYSLKVVEGYVGFKRTQSEYGGNWAMARYIEATETMDAVQRDSVMADILRYNEEDLAATWAVLQWLQNLAAQQ